MTIVECQNIRKTYRQGKVEVHALKQVSLSIERGGFVALAGPSGSGKTTLLNLIGGLDRPDEGTIFLDGQELGALSQGALAGLRLSKIGFIFQAYNLVPVLSALENVAFVMELQGIARGERQERAASMLDEVGLKGMHHRRPSELSGGQQQRVAVARAIVSQPAIVLADEPTANLDSKTGEGLLEMMRALNKNRGVTFVFSTHDRMVMDYATRLVRIKDGGIVGEESRKELVGLET